jgi:hypothetical protein
MPPTIVATLAFASGIVLLSLLLCWLRRRTGLPLHFLSRFSGLHGGRTLGSSKAIAFSFESQEMRTQFCNAGGIQSVDFPARTLRTLSNQVGIKAAGVRRIVPHLYGLFTKPSDVWGRAVAGAYGDVH